MTHRVKGTLFVDYVRMVRSRKDADWAKHLPAEDLEYLQQPIRPADWYPMETFERLGIAILREIAGGDLDSVRRWGQVSVEALRMSLPDLIVPGDPRESLMRMQVLRASFFDFRALEIEYVSDREARIKVAYGMSPVAEEAASHQTLGFLERLAFLAGARQCQATFVSRSWAGDPVTVIELHWR